MNTKAVAAFALVTIGVLYGCEKAPLDNAAKSTLPDASPSAPTAQTTVPAGDPSVPPAKAALERPKSATDATPETEVTRPERDKAMPLPGQANDHSNPEFAKRGDDQQTPAKSSK